MKTKFFLLGVALLALIITQSAASSNPLPLTGMMFALQNDFFPGPQQALSGAPCNGSLYVKDVTIPDGTQVAPLTTFVKKWEIKNTGSCGWSKKYSLQFFDGDRLSGETVYLTKWVAPRDTVVIAVQMSAPETPGKYLGYWIMANGGGVFFGSYVTIKIEV